MTFLTIVVRGLSRRPVRTGLTLVGISIGIAAVVALVGLASGYEKSIGKQLDVIGIDVVVSNMTGGFLPKVFDASLQEKIAKTGRARREPDRQEPEYASRSLYLRGLIDSSVVMGCRG